MLPTKISQMDHWLLSQTSKSDLEMPVINLKKITMIETADFLNPLEKARLLLIMLRKRFVCELNLRHKDQKATLLKALGLFSFENSRIHSSKGLIRWLQVCANRKIQHFVKKYSNSMSALIAGTLYGYPPTSILAFMNLVPRVSQPQNINTFPIIIMSRDWFKHELKLIENDLRCLRKSSPIIYAELVNRVRRT